MSARSCHYPIGHSSTNTILLCLYILLSGVSIDRGSEDRTSGKAAANEPRGGRRNIDKMIGWWTATATATLLAFLGYVAFFWKINWVRGLKENASSKRAANGFMGTKNRKLGELPPVYPNGWFALLETRQLAKGEVKHVAALGENFAVFRSDQGQVNILDAYCPHLGANMAEGGKVKGDCLVCPFHSWSFQGNDGVCKSIPYSKQVPIAAKAKAWKCCEVNEIIFVWYHAESSEPHWRPQPLESISNGTWWYQGRNEFLISSHIQEIPENGADVAHLGAVHGPAMFLKDALPGFMRHDWTGAKWAPKTPLGDRSNYSTDKRHLATIKLCHKVKLCERFSILELNVTAEQIGPGYVELMILTTFGPMCILQTVTPLEPLMQRVTHLIFSPPLLGPYARIVFLGECIMFERDIAVWNHKKYEKRPVLVKEDRTIKDFRRWYTQFYSHKSPTYKSVKSLEF